LLHNAQEQNVWWPFIGDGMYKRPPKHFSPVRYATKLPLIYCLSQKSVSRQKKFEHGSCAPMFKFFSAPPGGALRSIKFQTADFPIFCTRIIVIFWTTCIAREVSSVVLMGIALPQKRHCLCF